jgi:hypothetical protein
MDNQEMMDLYTGKHEVEITDELIKQIAESETPPLNEMEIKRLKDFQSMGWKYNTKRKTFVGPTEGF